MDNNRIIKSTAAETALAQIGHADDQQPAAQRREPQFDACSSDQEQLAVKFCAEIAAWQAGPGVLFDPVRLFEMCESLYIANRNECRPTGGNDDAVGHTDQDGYVFIYDGAPKAVRLFKAAATGLPTDSLREVSA